MTRRKSPKAARGRDAVAGTGPKREKDAPSSPQVGRSDARALSEVPIQALRHLVDVVWGEAHENESVPSTEWADRMIAKAIDTYAHVEFCLVCNGLFIRQDADGCPIHRKCESDDTAHERRLRCTIKETRERADAAREKLPTLCAQSWCKHKEYLPPTSGYSSRGQRDADDCGNSSDNTARTVEDRGS